MNPLDGSSFTLTPDPMFSKDVELSSASSASTKVSANPTATSQRPTKNHKPNSGGKHRNRLSVADFANSANVPGLNFSQNSVDVSTVLELCAVKLKDAVSGRFRAYRLRRRAIKWYLMYHQKWYRLLLMLVTLLHLCLILFEPASSINLSPPELRVNATTAVRAHVRNHNRFVPVSDYYSIFLPTTTLCELVFILFHWGDIYVQYKLSGGTCKVAFDYTWFGLKFVVVSLMTLNVSISLVLVFGFNEHPFNFMRLLRPLLLMEQLANVRKILKSVVNSFIKIKYVITALFFLIFFFAIVATALFRGVTGVRPEVPPEDRSGSPGCRFLAPSSADGQDGVFCSSFSKNCLDYWKSLWHSWMHLFTTLTTAK
jgi:hypothetical protein